MCCLPLQAGVASSRSIEEVAELEQALCFLIKRSADITDAKAAKLHAQINSAVNHADHAEADNNKAGNTLSVDHAKHAEGDNSKSRSEEAGVSEPSVSASSELITPELEKLLPKAAHRVSFLLYVGLYMGVCEPGG